LPYPRDNALRFSAGQFDAGTSVSATGEPHGYGCLLPQFLREWRTLASAVPGTNDPEFPFAVMLVHDGGEEGWGGMVTAMHYAHTAGYGRLPNAAMPNTVLAANYDGGDPWDGGEACARNSCCVETQIPLGPTCVGDHRGDYTNSTPDGGGIVHPRAKDIPGRRFAQAVFSTWYDPAGPLVTTGPVFAGCTLSGSTLTLTFDAVALKGKRVVVGKPAGAAPMSLELENSALYVLINASGLPADTGEGYNPCAYGSTAPCAYSYTGPWSWGNELGVTGWAAVLPQQGAAANEVVVDLSHLNGAVPTAIRYAAGSGSGFAFPNGTNIGNGCERICTGPYVDCTREPAALEACPLKSSNATGGYSLPAVPFRANIVGGKCKCLAPQVCDG